MSRLRSKSKLHHQMVFTANPRECWLKPWVEYCLDEDGVPKPGTENIIRWFVRINNTMHWADSREELLERFPEALPLSFRFIPATCEDNPVLLKARPDYLSFLQSLKKVDQLRLWKGSWNAREIPESYFDRENVKEVDRAPDNLELVRSWDLAATPEPEPGTSQARSDWSVGVLMGRSKSGQYYVLDVNRFRKSTNDVIAEIVKTAYLDGTEDCLVTIPRDPGASGVHFFNYLSRTLIEHGLNVKGVKMSGHSNKLKRFLPFAALVEAGHVSVVRAPWNKIWYEELEAFTGGTRNQWDDQVDATSDAATMLMKQSTLPTFSLSNSDFTRPSPLPA